MSLGIFLYGFCCVYAKEISLPEKMQNYHDTIKVALANAELEKATRFAVTYLELVKGEFSEDEFLVAVDLLFKCYRRQTQYSEALSFLNDELAWAIANDDNYIATTLRYYIGLIYREMYEIDKAIDYFLLVKKEMDEGKYDQMLEDELAIAKIIIRFDLGTILVSVDPEKTLSYFDEAKSIAREINDSIYMADSYLNIGWAYLEMYKHDSAEIYLDSAMVIYDQLANNNGRASVYLEKGILLEHQSKDKTACSYYLKSYDLLFKDSKCPNCSYFLKQKTLKLLVDFYIGDEDFDTALIYAKELLKLVSDFQDRKSIAYISNRIANIYEKKNDELAALRYYKLSNENYEILKFEDVRIDVLKKATAFNDEKDKEKLEQLEVSLKSKERSIAVFALCLVVLAFVSIQVIKKLKDSELRKAQKIKANEDIIFQKNQSMTDLSLIHQSKNQFIDYLKDQLQTIYNDSAFKSPELKKLIFQLKVSSNKDEEWKRIRKYHMELEPSFYKEIQNRWPKLTNLDLRHCTLLKLKMSNKEAAELLGISPKSVQMARYRLTKKLNYDSLLSLKNYIASI